MFAQARHLQSLAGGGGERFEEFILDLVREEAFRHGISPDKVHWDPRTNIPDGGRDIVVTGSHNDENPRFIPRRPSIWSAKSGKDGTSPSKLKAEILAPHHQEVREHLRAGYPYVVCVLHSTSHDEEAALRDKVIEIAKNDPFFNPDQVEFRFVDNLRHRAKIIFR